MAEAGVIQELFVKLGIKGDPGSAKSWMDGLNQLQNAVNGLTKALAPAVQEVEKLDKAFEETSKTPTTKLKGSLHEVTGGVQTFGKAVKDNSAVLAAGFSGWVAGIEKVVQKYQTLGYQTQALKGNANQIKDMQFGFTQIGISLGEADAALNAFGKSWRDNPAFKFQLKGWISTEDADYVKKQFGNILSPAQKQFEEAIHALNRMPPTMRKTFADMAGIDTSFLEQVKNNEASRVEAYKKSAEARKEAGVDANKTAQAALDISTKWGELSNKVELAWTHAFTEMAPHLTRFIGALTDIVGLFNSLAKAVPFASTAATLLASAGAAKIFLGILSKIASTMGIIKAASGAGGAAAVAAGAGGSGAAVAGGAVAGAASSFGRKLLGTAGKVNLGMLALQAYEGGVGQKGFDWNKNIEEGGLQKIPKELRDKSGGWRSGGGAGALYRYLFGGNEEEAGPSATAPIPPLVGHAQGGVIKKTGPAFVHEGEAVLPAKLTNMLMGMSSALTRLGAGAGGVADQVQSSLMDWLTGGSLTPKVAVSNWQDFIDLMMGGRGGGRGAGFQKAAYSPGGGAGGGGGGEGGGGEAAGETSRRRTGGRFGGMGPGAGGGGTEESETGGGGGGGGGGGEIGGGAGGKSTTLTGDRQKFAEELKNNPELRTKILRIAANEQGKSGRGTQQVIESMMNRASVTGTSLARQARWHESEGGYYQQGNMGAGALENAGHRKVLETALENALAGGNLSNYATDNASQGLAIKDEQQGLFKTQAQSKEGGRTGQPGVETFFSPGSASPGLIKKYNAWRAGMEKGATGGMGGGGNLPTGGSVDPVGAVDTALKMQGMHEEADRGAIKSFLKSGGVGLDPAVSAWCAAYVNANLKLHGIKGSGSAIATSFAKWGKGVSPEQAMKGDVGLQMKGARPGQTGGHVGLLTGDRRTGESGEEELEVIAGNTKDKVKTFWEKADKLVIRRSNEVDKEQRKLDNKRQSGIEATHKRMKESSATVEKNSVSNSTNNTTNNDNRRGSSDRNATMNINNTTHISGGGEKASGERYAKANTRIYGDLHRNFKTVMA